MWRAPSQIGCLSLETQAASARLALACVYSGAEEYEASVIARRRRAGAYGHRRRHTAIAAAVIGAALLLFVAL